MKHYKNPSIIQVSLTLGVISLLTWFIPVIGVPVALVGMILGIRKKGEKGERAENGRRRWAIGLNSLGLILAFSHGILGSIVG